MNWQISEDDPKDESRNMKAVIETVKHTKRQHRDSNDNDNNDTQIYII